MVVVVVDDSSSRVAKTNRLLPLVVKPGLGSPSLCWGWYQVAPNWQKRHPGWQPGEWSFRKWRVRLMKKEMTTRTRSFLEISAGGGLVVVKKERR